MKRKTFKKSEPLPLEDEEQSLTLKSQVPLSPFIIRLTNKEASQDEFSDEEEPLEAALVQAVTDSDSLYITPDELQAQLREPILDRDVSWSELAHVGPIRVRDEGIMPVLELPVEGEDVVGKLMASNLKGIELLEIDDSSVAVNSSPVLAVSTNLNPWEWRGALASFVLFAVLAVFPLQALQVLASTKKSADDVKSESNAALSVFLRGAASLSDSHFSSAERDFRQAAQAFSGVEDSLDEMHGLVLSALQVIPETESTISSVRGLVRAGEELSEAAEIMTLAAQELSGDKVLTLAEKIRILEAYIEKVRPNFVAAEEALDEVDTAAVPEEYVSKINQLKVRIPQTRQSIDEFLVFTDALVLLLGGEGKVRYLAAFQNNAELRPTGGFVGSFAQVDMLEGEIDRLSVPGGGSYATQGQLTSFVAAPGPVQLLKSRWEFQDSNWFPDFPTSAEKMLWFAEHSGLPTMDGVLAVNASFVQQLIALLGPIEMPAYGRTITAENFLLETQKIVELEYDKEINAPKAFIGDLAPILLERIKEADFRTLLSLLSLISQGLEEKDIILYFRDNKAEALMEELGWSGSLHDTAGDYLMTVSTNLGGGKTDTVIKESVKVEVDILPDGTVENTVSLTKEHKGLKNELFRGVNNVDYVRFYVPRGSELISGTGFAPPPSEAFEVPEVALEVDEDLALNMKAVERDQKTGTDIWQEGGKTVFGNWMQTAPGETEVITMTYRLPFKVDLTKPFFPYSVFVQKQPGVTDMSTRIVLNPPAALGLLWQSALAGDNLTAELTNTEDAFVAWLLEPR